MEGSGSESTKLVSCVVSKPSTRDHKDTEPSIIHEPNSVEDLFKKSRLTLKTSRSML